MDKPPNQLPNGSSRPLSSEQLLRTQINLLRADRERQLERTQQAIAAIDRHIERLTVRLAAIQAANLLEFEL